MEPTKDKNFPLGQTVMTWESMTRQPKMRLLPSSLPKAWSAMPPETGAISPPKTRLKMTAACRMESVCFQPMKMKACPKSGLSPKPIAPPPRSCSRMSIRQG